MASTTTEPLRLGVITGLKKEIACLRPSKRPDGLHLWCEAVAGNPALAAETARHMASEGATALMSFGVAGGLDPSLGPGMIVIADQVIDREGRRFACHAAWVSALLHLDGAYDSGTLLGSDHPIATPQHKARLFQQSQALAVDMESHAVAEVARETGLPFIAVRAIGDPAGRAIPGAALGGLAPDGSTRAWPVVRGMLKHPWEIRAIFRLAKDTNRALAALKEFAGADLAATLKT